MVDPKKTNQGYPFDLSAHCNHKALWTPLFLGNAFYGHDSVMSQYMKTRLLIT